MSIDLTAAKRQFEEHFGAPPGVIARAPGRVNIIGEHTDYNEGFVLPMAIERETALIARLRDDGLLNVYAANLERAAQMELTCLERHPEEPWIDYVVGVARELERMDKALAGADVMIVGDVPIGAGLSSSASLEMAAVVLFESLGGYSLPGPEAASLGKRVENEFLGVNSGIMDQFIARMGREGHALFLDCRTYVFELIPVAFPDATFVIADTGVTRGLTASKYNERVAECQAAVEALRTALGREKATHLRDFTIADLEACAGAVPETPFRRARHILTENDRTQSACRAMREGDAKTLGELMNASHWSLADDYEVTCAELDAMTEIARGLPGCLGARMTGAGFGGCTVHLVSREAVEGFARKLLTAYRERTGLEGSVIVSAPGRGASAVPC